MSRIRITFVSGPYSKTIKLRDTDLRDMQIMSMWQGMRYAVRQLSYDDKIARIAEVFNLSQDRVRNIVSEQERRRHKISDFPSGNRD